MIETYKKDMAEILRTVKYETDLANFIKRDKYAKKLIELAVNDQFPEFDFIDISYHCNDLHDSLAGALLLSRSSLSLIEGVFYAKSVSVRTKAKQYKALMEMLSGPESDILLGIMSKNLVSYYPTLTHSFICEALDIGS